MALGALAGCNKTDPGPVSEQPRVSPAVAGEAATPAATVQVNSATAGVSAAAPSPEAAAAPARVSEANFELSLTPKGDAEAKKPAEAQIVLVAKPPFHVNDKYPYKFKLKETPGLTFAAPVVGKESLALEPAKATLLVKFTPETAGRHQISGQFSFSVCTDDKCLIEKRDLALAIDAK